MTSSTLRGIFPDPKPVHRRNFVQENIKHLKEMQGFIQKETKLQAESPEPKSNKFKGVAPRVYSNTAAVKKMSKDSIGKRPHSLNQISRNLRAPVHHFYNRHKLPVEKTSHRGVQTERPEDIPKLYQTGVLKFPSAAVAPHPNSQTTQKPKNQGDASPGLARNMQKLDLSDETNHIQRNIKNLKAKPKPEETPDPIAPPPNYQKGVVPKYLKEKKDASQEQPKTVDYERENFAGLLLLPDEERKEYLRVARENYAALIKELNAMPVSNDTLKRRKRKMEIEEELKRLDEVIKIFQKPKVFVKADA